MGNLTFMIKSQIFGEGGSWGSFLVLLFLCPLLLPPDQVQDAFEGGGGSGAATRDIRRSGKGR